MSTILRSLLEGYNKNIHIGLPATHHLALSVSDDDLHELFGHFQTVAGHEAEEFLMQSVDAVQYQYTEQVSFVVISMKTIIVCGSVRIWI
jgi:hypothetical protein